MNYEEKYKTNIHSYNQQILKLYYLTKLSLSAEKEKDIRALISENLIPHEHIHFYENLFQ